MGAMSDPERIDLKDYMREQFGVVHARLNAIDTRLEALESKEDQRTGRNNFLATSLKTIGGLLAAALAALGIKSQL